MDKPNRYMTKDQDAARSIVLKRQQRISIEANSRMLIKNTQSQVRELYRREKQKLRVGKNLIPPEISSSLSDAKIVEARIEVETLNKRIVNEIVRLKSFRDYFKHEESNRSSSSQRELISNRTWDQSLAANNSIVNISDEARQDTNRSLSPSNPISPRSDESRPRFRTLGVKPSSKQEKDLMNMVEADSENSSHERISGGSTFGNKIPDHCSVYQCDYAQSAMNRPCPTHCNQPLQPMISYPQYHGPTTTICCDYSSPASSSPMPQATNQMYQYAVGSPCQQQSQHYPNTVQNCSVYPFPTYPNYTRRATDLNTEDFYQLWCQKARNSRSPCNGRTSRSLPKECGRSSSARSRPSCRSPSLSAKSKFENQVKKKIKEAGISDSISLAKCKVKDHKKNTTVTLQKHEQANNKKSTKTVNGQMVIRDYVPAKSPKRNAPPANKAHMYKEYMNLYQKQNEKTNIGGHTASKKNDPEVEAHPTYTKIQDLKPPGNKTPQSWTKRSYGSNKTKLNQPSQHRSSQPNGKSTKLSRISRTQTPTQQNNTSPTSSKRVMNKAQPKLDHSRDTTECQCTPSPIPSITKQTEEQRPVDEVREEPGSSKYQPQEDSNFNSASKDRSSLKDKLQGEPTDSSKEKQSEPRPTPRDDIFVKSPFEPTYSQNEQRCQLPQQERQSAYDREKDSDSGLGRYSDSGNQPQSNDNRQPISPKCQKQCKTEPTDDRWGTNEGHRLSHDSHFNEISEDTMKLAAGEIESTTSICRTCSQHLVSTKRSNKKGSQTKRYNKECESYVTKDIGLESKLPQTSKNNTSSKHSNQTECKMPHTSDESQSSDTVDPSYDTRQFSTMPRRQEERLTQTDILMQEERLTQTDLETTREERLTQTEPDETHERLTQTDPQVSGRHERLTQTEIFPNPKTGCINGQKDQHEQTKNNEVRQSAKSDADLEEMSLSSSRYKDAFDGKNSGDKSAYSTQPSPYPQAKVDQSQLQNRQHRSSTVPSSSYYSFDPPSLQKEQKATASSPTNSRAPSNGNIPKEPGESSEQVERCEGDYDRYIVDRDEILCGQYRQNFNTGPKEPVYRQQIPAPCIRRPEYESQNRREQQWEYSYESRVSCDGPSTSIKNTGPISKSHVNSYDWRHTVDANQQYANPGNVQETYVTYNQRVQRFNSNPPDCNEGTMSSEYSDACSSFNDNYSSHQQMTCNSSAANQVNCNAINPSMQCNPCGRLPLHYYHQQAFNPQESRTQYYSQYPLNKTYNHPTEHLPSTNATEMPQRRFYNAPQKFVDQSPPPRPPPNANASCIIQKRIRTVKFDDEHCQTRIKRNAPESLRSSIDWDRAYKQGLLADKMRSGYLSDSETEIINTCRSSSSANTEVTCVDSNYEEEEEITQNRFRELPPFNGCPCMLNTYNQLATLHANK